MSSKDKVTLFPIKTTLPETVKAPIKHKKQQKNTPIFNISFNGQDFNFYRRFQQKNPQPSSFPERNNLLFCFFLKFTRVSIIRKLKHQLPYCTEVYYVILLGLLQKNFLFLDLLYWIKKSFY